MNPTFKIKALEICLATAEKRAERRSQLRDVSGKKVRTPWGSLRTGKDRRYSVSGHRKNRLDALLEAHPEGYRGKTKS